jgi:hypothetical protein
MTFLSTKLIEFISLWTQWRLSKNGDPGAVPDSNKFRFGPRIAARGDSMVTMPPIRLTRELEAAYRLTHLPPSLALVIVDPGGKMEGY